MLRYIVCANLTQDFYNKMRMNGKFFCEETEYFTVRDGCETSSPRPYSFSLVTYPPTEEVQNEAP